MQPATAQAGGALLLGVLLLAPPAQAASQAEPRPVAGQRRSGSPLLAVRAWVERARRSPAGVGEREAAAVREDLADLATLWDFDPMRGEEIGGLFLDVLGLTVALWSPTGEELVGPGVRALRDATLAELERRYDPDFARWIAGGVLARAGSAARERRLGAAWLLRGRRDAATLMGLLHATRDEDRRLVLVALAALEGWDHEAVHTLFVDLLARTNAGDEACLVAERHLTHLARPLEGRAHADLVRLARVQLASPDWRTASRAVALARGLDTETAVPALIEALTTWNGRAERGLQTLRVQNELVRELTHRSGRRLGLSGAAWRVWWDRYLAGEAADGALLDPRLHGTQATFFGLDLKSDRVLFVLDRSLSMSSPFAPTTGAPGAPSTGSPGGRPSGSGPRGTTRWEELVEQLSTCLQTLGEKGRFGVVVFHDWADRWKEELVDAGEGQRAAARRWLLAQKPNGGTHLRAGIDTALAIGSDGSPDLSKIEADTVVVLCDGATSEGSDWVAPFLRRVNPFARIVFHGIQVGGEGDGTLEELARQSGGDFLRVRG